MVHILAKGLQGLCVYPKISGSNCKLMCCCVRGALLSNSETDLGELPKAREGHSNTERVGVAQTNHLKAQLQHFVVPFRSESSAIDTLWSSQ